MLARTPARMLVRSSASCGKVRVSQLVLLLGVMMLFAARERGAIVPGALAFTPGTPAQGLAVLGGVVLAVALVQLGAHLACLALAQRMDRTGRWSAARAAHRCVAVARWATLASLAIGLHGWGLLEGVRLIVGGDRVLIDEAVAIAPLVLGMVWGWRAIAPIEQRVRDATLLRRLDAGALPAPSHGTRGYVVDQVRHQLLTLLVPVALLSGWWELGRRVLPWDDHAWQQVVTLIAGTAALIALMPLALRMIWPTVPIGPGALRERLLGVCYQHRVRVSDLLLWRTGTGIANAAVVGVLPWVRYVLLSDALLDHLSDIELEAVMAHEIAHIRRRHMLWMGAFVLALATVVCGGAATLCELALVDPALTQRALQQEQDAIAKLAETPMLGLPEAARGLARARRATERAMAEEEQQRVLAAGLGLLAGLPVVAMGFGMVSRLAERQADAFAVQHLSGMSSARVADATGADADGRSGRDKGALSAAGRATLDPSTDSDSHDPAMLTGDGVHATAGAEPGPAEASAVTHRAGLITAEAVRAMSLALDHVARVNGMDPGRFEFRHGSILGRQMNLLALVGKPIASLRVDRLMARVQWLTVALFVAAGAMLVFL
jgi:Zn-dependent protease with chaperone function